MKVPIKTAPEIPQVWRYALLFAVAGATIVPLAVHGPIRQDASYHDFADQRIAFGIPNFSNVVSNALFLIAGVAGLRTMTVRSTIRGAYVLFFLAVVAVSLGSAWYHLRPANETLPWDRLPMTVAFMAFFSIVISQHIGPKLLPFWIALGVFSVVYWRMTDDLRPYAIVQFLPVVLIPLILLLFPPLLSKPSFLWRMLVSYAVAKCFEMLDAPIYRAIGISGHTLKHLAAAAGVLFLVMALRDPHLNYPHVRTGNPAPSHPPVAR